MVSWVRMAMLGGLFLACSGSQSSPQNAALSDQPELSSPTKPATPAKAVLVSWVAERVPKTSDDDPDRTQLSLSMTDETGATFYERLDVFVGTCKPGQGPKQTEDVEFIIRCMEAGNGVELQIVYRSGALIILTGRVESGILSSFEPGQTIALPAGAAARFVAPVVR